MRSAIQPRFDGLDTFAELGEIRAQFVNARHVGVCKVPGVFRDPPQVLITETERPGEAGERGAGTGLRLDLPQRGGRDARSLGKLPLAEAPFLHPAVNDLCHGCPVRHLGPLLGRASTLTADRTVPNYQRY
jgi:hypothetical protein